MTESTTKRKPRLLVLASTYPRWPDDPEPGFVHELAKRLTDSFDVTVLGPHAPYALTDEVMDGVKVVRYRYAPERLETLVNDGGIVTNLRRSAWKWLLVPGFLLGLAWRTWRLIRTQNPDVIHAHWLLPQGLIAALLGLVAPHTPFLVTSHGADLFALRARPLQALKRFVASRATAITVVSKAMQHELERIGVDATKSSVQPMGVDLSERFIPDPTVNRSRDEILFVGRLVEKKGLRYLINAMPSILCTRPLAYLTVAGFGPEEAERRAQVVQLGLEDKVQFIGAVPQNQLSELYQRAAVFVAPFVQAADGDQEGLGLVAVEAAGCGCPVVVSDLPVINQVFPSREDAIRVRPAAPEALATAVLSVLDGNVSGGETAALQRLRKAFDWDSRACCYSTLLVGICDSKSPRSADKKSESAD